MHLCSTLCTNPKQFHVKCKDSRETWELKQTIARPQQTRLNFNFEGKIVSHNPTIAEKADSARDSGALQTHLPQRSQRASSRKAHMHSYGRTQATR